jgi:hypothetical protein
VQAVTYRPFQGWGDAGQGVAQAAGQPGRVGGQVDVVAVEHQQCAEQLIGAGIQPVHLLAPGPASISHDVSVAAVRLRLTGVQVGGAGEQPLPVAVEHISEVLALADIHPDPHPKSGD